MTKLCHKWHATRSHIHMGIQETGDNTSGKVTYYLPCSPEFTEMSNFHNLPGIFTASFLCSFIFDVEVEKLELEWIELNGVRFHPQDIAWKWAKVISYPPPPRIIIPLTFPY